MAYLFVDAMLAPESGWLAWLIALLVKGALVLSVAAMIALLLRRSAAASRHLVWSLALASLFALPLLSLALPAWQWSPLPDLLASPEASSASLLSASVDASAFPAAHSLADVPANESSAAPLAQANDPSSEAARPVTDREALSPSVVARPFTASLPKDVKPSRATASSAARWSGWMQWAIYVWLVGAALVLAHLLIGVARILRLTRQAETVRDAEWLRLVNHLSRRLALTYPVALRRSARVTMPMACGFVRSSVLLPADADDWSDERREVVLLHELAHVKRRDCLTQLIAQAACAIYWFNPLVWVAARRLRIERERACDDQVLDAGAKASDYAGHLLDIARSMGAAPSALMAAVPIARRSQLEGRLLAILDPRLHRRAASRVTVIFIAMAMVGVVLPLAMLRPAASAQTRRERAASVKAAASPQSPRAVIVASPSMIPVPVMAAAPLGTPLVEAEAAPEIVAAPPDSPGLIEAAPAMVAAPQTPASASLNQQDRDAVVEGLRDALKDDDPEMREQAIFTLAQVSGPRATEVILSALKDSDPAVREKAAWALGMRHGEGLVEALIAALRDTSAGVRENAAWALGLRGDSRSVDALAAALRDESAEVREKAAWALGLKGNRNAVEPLIAALKDQSGDVRATAAWALGLRGDARAIPALNAAMKDASHDVRDKARWALGMLLMRSGQSVSVSDKDNDKDNEIDEDNDGRTAHAISGGIATGIAVGVSGGVSGGISGGVGGGVARGTRGGVRGGIASGVAGGVSGGISGGVATGVAGDTKMRQHTEVKTVVKSTTRQQTTKKQL
jgi:beta-lactamase regulating signal transducer with metallopeptidase domain/HEAT repeat protein